MNRVPDEERYRRVVEEGSNRKRDLAGYHRVRDAIEAQTREHAVARMQGCGEDVSAIWAAARECLQASVAESTYQLWLAPVEPAGVDGDTLYLSAPDDIRAWAERRYSSLIEEALQHCSSFTRVSFAAPALSGSLGVAA